MRAHDASHDLTEVEREACFSVFVAVVVETFWMCCRMKAVLFLVQKDPVDQEGFSGTVFADDGDDADF